jgi:hypothetical protein
VPETPIPRPYHDFALNEPIALYEGSIELASGGSVLRRGPGRVHLEWLPSLRIAYELDGTPSGDPLYTGEATLRLPDLDTVTEAAFEEVGLALGLSGAEVWTRCTLLPLETCERAAYAVRKATGWRI